MSASTGPILATGLITMANQTVLNGQPFDVRVPIATGLLIGGFTLLDKALPEAAPILAWTLLVSVLFTRIKPDTPSPTESIAAWWEASNSKKG